MASSGETLPDRCVRLLPCLSDPVRRGALCVRFSLVAFHVVAVGVLFLWDVALVERTRREPWYTAVFLGLFVVTLIQYFFTAGSSPGYVEDAMRTGNVRFEGSPLSLGISNQSASSETARLLPSSDNNQLRRNVGRMNSSSWSTMVMELYPQGTTSRNWHCVYCLALQPPRSKHCHDCEKCVLQFDHHCVWLGTCIGQKNHCRFWWYVVEEAILCLWTVILYFSYLEQKVKRIWWKDAVSILIVIILLLSLIFLLLLVIFHTYLILTNQTTYELVRRRRIPYLRNLPEKTRPFSQGICRNLHSFCCSFGSSYILEAFPTAEELEDKMKPYTCMDVISCRCC